MKKRDRKLDAGALVSALLHGACANTNGLAPEAPLRDANDLAGSEDFLRSRAVVGLAVAIAR